MYLHPGYVTAILNHPLWRLWTSAFAAGKRQRNLSQEHLWQIKLPSAPANVQEAISNIYAEILKEIYNIFEEPDTISPLCDFILGRVCNLKAPAVKRSIASVEPNRLADLCGSEFLRFDHRFLRSDFRIIQTYLTQFPNVPFSSCLSQALIKNSQPVILVEDDGEAPRVIATASLQFGQIVKEFTKPTSAEYFSSAEGRKVLFGDVLIAMDGDGSIGKAAVFLDEYDGVCDSHVAIARVGDLNSSLAIACFLNSTFGQVQIGRMISGATGQVQLSSSDLLTLQMPSLIQERASDIANEYRQLLQGFVSPVTRVRRAVCKGSAEISKLLSKLKCFDNKALALIKKSEDDSWLYKQLAILKPKMF